MTNYELIKQKVMESQTAEELVVIIRDMYNKPFNIQCSLTKCSFYTNCENCRIEWLNKKVEK